MRKRRSQSRLGNFWLDQRPGRPHWYICWLDKRSGQVRRTSTGTGDPDEAERKLAEHFQLAETLEHERPQDVPLVTILERYYHEHASKLPSRVQARIALDLFRKHAGDLSVADFKLAAQERIKATLVGQGKSESYVRRTFDVARAALRRAHRLEEITAIPPILKLEKGEPRDRVLTIAEAAALFNAARTDSQWLYLVIAFATAARPTAILELTRSQLDFANNVIRLNPRGRRQTKKRRPTIPMIPTLKGWLEEGGPGYVLAHGKAHAPYSRDGWRAIFNRLATRAELPGVSAYTIRHTVATEMARRGVPEYEIKAMLGHVDVASGVTGHYVHFRPDFLEDAVAAIEAMLEEIGRLTKRPISRRELDEQPRPGDPLLAQTAELLAHYLPKRPRTSGNLALAIAPNSLTDLGDLVVGMRGFEPPTPTSRSEENPSKISSKSEQNLATPSTEDQGVSNGYLPITCPNEEDADGEPPSSQSSDEEGAT